MINLNSKWQNAVADVGSCLTQHGPVYKLAFGPKAFVVVSDPIVARHILRENAFGYDKVIVRISSILHTS